MSATVSTEHADLAEAVAEAVAELTGVPRSKVSVRVKGRDGRTGGPFHVELRAEGLGVDAPVEAAPEAQAAAEPPVQEAPVADGAPVSESAPFTAEDLDAEADAAADFLEGMLDAFDLPGDLRIRVLEDHAEVEIADIGNGALIGRRGQTLDAVQELVRSALQRQFERRSRVQIDAEGYRARRLEKLIEKAEEAIDEVLDTGESVRLEPMDVFERKAVHQIVAEVEGVVSRSQGREPGRRVIIESADDA